ncbi:MAG: hypothetical protein GQ559_05265, partial [Desulfobulbaceae bacterium]|nr:hypothetical protein [Desulfobulbaceae bacterium]
MKNSTITNSGGSRWRFSRPSLGTLFEGALLLAMLLPPFVLRGGNSLLSDISLNFLAICFEALPFMLVGSIAGGIIEVYVPRERMRFGEGRGRIASILVGGLLGLIFPVCECAIVVVIRRLLAKGIPLSAAIAFLLAGPIVNPVVTVSTAVAYRFDWTMVLTRLVCGYVIAVTVAAIIELFFSRKKA